MDQEASEYKVTVKEKNVQSADGHQMAFAKEEIQKRLPLQD